MLAYLRGLLGQYGAQDGWQLAEHAGEANPDGMQRLLAPPPGTRTWSTTSEMCAIQAFTSYFREGEQHGVGKLDASRRSLEVGSRCGAADARTYGSFWTRGR